MPKDQVNADDFAGFLIHKLKLLKLGIRMLQFNDFHIMQIGEILASIVKFAKPILDAFDLTSDFQEMANQITVEELREKDVDETKLSERAQKVKLNSNNYKEFLSSFFWKSHADLLKREPQEFVSYEHFANCVLIPKQADVEPPYLCFNLFTRYANAFNGLKQEFGDIIKDIHLNLA